LGQIEQAMNTRLYVGNLSFNTNADGVRTAFQEFGTVSDVHLVSDRETGRSRGFAFVTMGTPEEAAKAIEGMDGRTLDGRPLRVNEAEQRQQRGGGGGGGGGGGRGGGGGGGWGAEPTITQSATELSVTYTTGREGAAPVVLKFKLDGTDSVNQVMGREGAAPQTSKATWTGDKLVIKTTLANGERTQTVSLVGGKLTIEQTAPGREGAPMTTTATYAKK
jgi:RNA recognition motif-containing protein